MAVQVNIPLRAKLGVTLFVAVAAFLSVDQWLRQRSFRATFDEIELGRAELQIAEVQRAVDDLVNELSGEARALDEATIESTLDQRDQRVDVALVVSRSGEVQALEVRDPDSRKPISLRALPTERLATSHPFMSPWFDRSLPEGILETERGFLVVGSAQVGGGEEARLVVMGQLLTEARMAEMRGLTSIGFSLASMTGKSNKGPASVSQETLFEIQGQLAMGATVIVPDGAHGVAVGSLRDLRGIPTIALAVKVSEPIWLRLESYTLLTSVGLAIVFPLVLLVLLQFLVTGPLSRLTSMATAIAASDDRTLRVRMERRDEIGRLSHKFDAMLDEIERVRLAEARTARTVGRSEVAVDVMHNMGNLLNSVRVSAALARDGASAVQVDDLCHVLTALRDHRGELDRYLSDDPKGEHLLDFFEAVLAQLGTARQTAVGESDAVLEQVGEITDMVQSLLGETSSEEMLEVIDVDLEIQAAIQTVESEFELLSLSHDDRGGVPTIQLDSDGQFGGRIDRQRVHEVLVALLSNAWDAAGTGDMAQPIIRISSESAGPGRVRIVVSDNGPGLGPNCGEEIYSMGFTTREGRTGLGLHLASLAAAELGGELSVIEPSEFVSQLNGGPLKGASFAFDFPLQDGVSAAQDPASLKEHAH